MDKTTFAAVTIICLAALEGVALVLNRDGATFAAIMAVIGAVAGSILGFKVGLTKTPPGSTPPPETP